MEASADYPVDLEKARAESPGAFGAAENEDDTCPMRRELDCMAFPHFAPLLEASQDYASCSGCRFRSSSFDNLVLGLRRRSRSSKETEELVLELCGEASPSSPSSAPPPLVVEVEDKETPTHAGQEHSSQNTAPETAIADANVASDSTDTAATNTMLGKAEDSSNPRSVSQIQRHTPSDSNHHNHHNHYDHHKHHDDPGNRVPRSPRSLAKLHAAPAVRDFARRLRERDLNLQQELESAFHLVMLESIRNSMVSACQALSIFPPPPPTVDCEVTSDDCDFEDVAAPLPVIAQRLWNDQQKRERDQIESQATPASSSQCGGFASSLYRKAMTAAFIVDFAHEVGAAVPPMPESLQTMFQDFSSKAEAWSADQQRQAGGLAASDTEKEGENTLFAIFGLGIPWSFSESSSARETSDLAFETAGAISPPSGARQKDAEEGEEEAGGTPAAAKADQEEENRGNLRESQCSDDQGASNADLQSSSYFSAEGATRMLAAILNNGCIARSKSV